jgi:hypothetical protein
MLKPLLGVAVEEEAEAILLLAGLVEEVELIQKK